jgi:putative membrane protein
MLKRHKEDSMKRTIATLAFASILLSTAAYAQSAAEKTGVNSTLGIAPKTEDFIKEAAMSDMLEIEAAKIAQQKGDPQEKTFAGEMITDHTKTSTELKGLVSGEIKAALPTSLDDSAQKKLGRLRDTEPKDFASEYDPMQVRMLFVRMNSECRFRRFLSIARGWLLAGFLLRCRSLYS